MNSKHRNAIIASAIATETQELEKITNAKGAILLAVQEVGSLEGLTEKQRETYLEKVKKLMLKVGKPTRSADQAISIRRKVLVFMQGGHEEFTQQEAIAFVDEYRQKSVSIQGLETAIKQALKDKREAVTNSDDDENTQDDTNESEEIISNLPEIEDEPMPVSDTDIAISNEIQIRKTDDLHAYLKTAIDTGWTVEQIRAELDKLEAEIKA